VGETKHSRERGLPPNKGVLENKERPFGETHFFSYTTHVGAKFVPPEIKG